MPEPIKIHIKPVHAKAVRRKVPVRIPPEYPSNLLVVIFSKSALLGLRDFAASDTSYELGGVLVGTIGRSSKRLFVEIADFIPASKGISRRASFEFTNEAQEEIHQVMEARFRDSKIVGWFHTHPGYGIFLSGADQFIDQNYFREKYHVAIVLDPTKPGIETGVFVWDEEHARIRVPYFELG